MDKQFGYLVGCDNSQFLRKVSEASCPLFLNDIHVEDTYAFNTVVHDTFTTGLSGNRSNIFYTYYYRKNATKIKGFDYRVGVFGLKDEANIGRKTIYANYYLCAINELQGKNFFKHIFGTDYIEEQDFRESTNPEILFDRKYKTVDWLVDSKDKNTIVHIMEKLWTAQEENLESRFVILMDNAEKHSMELLRQVYLLIPAALRLSIGFATNVTTDDILNLIVNNQGLPIHIFTMDRKFQKNKEFDFPVVYFDLSKQDEYSYNQEKIEILNSVCARTGALSDICYKYAEKEILDQAEADQKAPSFRHLQNITKSLLSGDIFWWEKDEVNSVSQIYKAYYAQQELMQEEEIRKEVLYSFLVKKTEQGTLADEIIQMLQAPEDPENKKYLDFLKQEFHCTKKMKAIERTMKNMNEKHIIETEKIRNEAKDHEEQSLAALKKELEDQIVQYVDEIEKKKIKLNDLRREKNNLQQESEELKRNLKASHKKQEELIGFKDEYSKVSVKYESACIDIEEKKREIDELNKRIRQLSENNLKKDTRRSKILSVLIVAVFLIVGLGGGCVAGYMYREKIVDDKNDIERTITQTSEPTASPVVEPTASPVAEPTVSPVAEPTASPTPEPTVSSTDAPQTENPEVTPTAVSVGETAEAFQTESPEVTPTAVSIGESNEASESTEESKDAQEQNVYDANQIADNII